MTVDEARGPRSSAALSAMLVAALAAFCGFIALGLWQVQRLAWKEDLIARVERNVNAAPTAAPGPAAWPQLERAEAEYRRVRLRGRFAHELETLVGASTELGTGYWVLTPLHTAQGDWVLVNRGFVPPEQKARARRAGTEPTGEHEVVGLLRFSEPGGRLLQDNDPVLGRWYSRDVQAIATARGLAAQRVAPYFVDAVADPTVPAAWPRTGLTVLRFSNNHAVYAATWFALAAMVACAAGYLVLDERRLRRMATAAPGRPKQGRTSAGGGCGTPQPEANV